MTGMRSACRPAQADAFHCALAGMARAVSVLLA